MYDYIHIYIAPPILRRKTRNDNQIHLSTLIVIWSNNNKLKRTNLNVHGMWSNRNRKFKIKNLESSRSELT